MTYINLAPSPIPQHNASSFLRTAFAAYLLTGLPVCLPACLSCKLHSKSFPLLRFLPVTENQSGVEGIRIPYPSHTWLIPLYFDTLSFQMTQVICKNDSFVQITCVHVYNGNVVQQDTIPHKMQCKVTTSGRLPSFPRDDGTIASNRPGTIPLTIATVHVHVDTSHRLLVPHQVEPVARQPCVSADCLACPFKHVDTASIPSSNSPQNFHHNAVMNAPPYGTGLSTPSITSIRYNSYNNYCTNSPTHSTAWIA